MNDSDTIAAICSGVGSSIAIIRISGYKALEIGRQIWKSKHSLNIESSRKFLLGRILPSADTSGEVAFAVYMKGPDTFTGEDVLEIHAHGGATNSRRLLRAAINAGARQAEAGEFTYRAFINGKIDLTQAEAVCDFISAHNDNALHLAERQMDGVLGKKIKAVREKVMNILAECEARVDFPEDELDFIPIQEHLKVIESIEKELRKLYETKYEGKVIRDGVRAVIAGRPNAGKSSLMNLLLGYERAITTDIPGTTRDTLEEFVNIRGIPVKLIDTAGLRDSDDIIESMGIQKTLDSIESSQVIIWLLDASSDIRDELAAMTQYLNSADNAIAVWNKTDLIKDNKILPSAPFEVVEISVKNELGINNLLDAIETKVWSHHTKLQNNEVPVSQRHAEYILQSLNALPDAISNLKSENWELASIGFKSIINYLGSITGEDASIDIYETIFSRFCIGK
ncbi:MAG TPA: tRNA uridine-5-carboxymethylaminomethyl(34) synthesis GTPase MnmE [Lentisphaeria bacterium]|nr:MAG: tRNA uridine-5-carboxymethylaminomethyl(34) synthesis GTPase MnmE [Lentisphaerae bacterium GWF2_38_69]HBM15969.1 tRNA uridine-5-carboxymethylaminomethyl(34) synthesis GTPase MnmE [Lentisphaeria bacterium]